MEVRLRRRTRQGAGGQLPPPPQKKHFENPWKFGQMLGRIKNIWADLSEYVIKILTNFQLPPPGKHPMGSKVEILTLYVLFKTRIGVFQNQIKM